MLNENETKYTQKNNEKKLLIRKSNTRNEKHNVKKVN